MVDVYVRRVDDVSKATKSILEKLGWKDLIDAEDRVLIKPNFMAKPKVGVTTDLRLIQTVVDVLETRTSNIVVGETDSTEKDFDEVMKGLNLSCEVINLSKDKTVEVTGKYGVYNLPELALSSRIVNLPVLKTHILTKVTLGMKNLLGLIQNKDKIIFHSWIDKVLYDLYNILKPEINIVDAINSMDGRGPVKGRVRRTNFLMASRDLLALEVATCRLIGLEPIKVRHIKMALDENKVDYRLFGDAGFSVKFDIPNTTVERSAAFLRKYRATRKILDSHVYKSAMRLVKYFI